MTVYNSAPAEKQNERIRSIRRSVILFSSGIAIFRILATLPNLLFIVAETTAWQVVLAVGVGFITLTLFVFSLTFYLALHHRVERAATILVWVAILFSFVGQLDQRSFLNGLVAILFVSIFASRPTYLFGVCVIILTQFYGVIQLFSMEILPLDRVLQSIFLLTMLAQIAIAIRLILKGLQDYASEITHVSELVTKSTMLGNAISGAFEIHTLLDKTVDFVRDQFGFYHVQIFLIDATGTSAVLRASTGEVGRQLLANNHQLAVGSNSVIGRASQSGRPILATSRDNVHYYNELLPYTLSELALPILRDETLVGILDVQSTLEDAFSREMIQALEVINTLFASALQNVELFDQQKLIIQESQKLYEESETNLREVRRLNRENTQQAWEEYFQVHGEKVVGVGVDEHDAIYTPAWSSPLSEAIQTQKAISHVDPTSLIAVPITIRGETFGAIEVEIDSSQDQEETKQVMNMVAERLAISIENARLFEEAQTSALIEQRINAIVNQYQVANQVDELFQITLKELSDLLRAERATVQLIPSSLTTTSEP
ncbi:MAG: GAF domain-containing protein [Phototrophicaceae bacterium]